MMTVRTPLPAALERLLVPAQPAPRITAGFNAYAALGIDIDRAKAATIALVPMGEGGA
jgi:hypothetical protein